MNIYFIPRNNALLKEWKYQNKHVKLQIFSNYITTKPWMKCFLRNTSANGASGASYFFYV